MCACRLPWFASSSVLCLVALPAPTQAPELPPRAWSPRAASLEALAFGGRPWYTKQATRELQEEGECRLDG